MYVNCKFLFSVVSHPSENLVASAQCDSSTSSPSSCKLKEDPNPGNNHIRVWNHVGLETIHIIGTGILRHPVFKMSFLNVQVIFLLIVNNIVFYKYFY